MMDNLFDKLLMRTLKIEHGLPILLGKVDFVMFPARAMAKVVQKLSDDLGEDYTYQLGYDAGKIVAKEFVDNLNWIERGLSKRMFALLKMFEVMGFGKMDLKVWDSKNKRTLVYITNHPVINHAARLFGGKEKVCSFYRGIYSAHSDFEFGLQGCKLIETQCIRNGAPYCEWSYNYFKNPNGFLRTQKAEAFCGFKEKEKAVSKTKRK